MRSSANRELPARFVNLSLHVSEEVTGSGVGAGGAGGSGFTAGFTAEALT